MADDRDRAIKDYAVSTPQVMHLGIVRPDVKADNFEFRLVMFQILQQWGNLMDCHQKIHIYILNYFWK